MKKIKTMVFTMLALFNLAAAQTDKKSPRQNPYSLVYEGAITENVKGKINIHPVTYKIKDITFAANVYTQPNYDVIEKAFKQKRERIQSRGI